MLPPAFEHEALRGARYYKEYITRTTEGDLLANIDAHPRAWKQLGRRKLQNWGGLPHIKGMLPCALPPFLRALCAQAGRDAFEHCDPNHVLVNRYEAGEGICAHKDGPAYRSVAAIISLAAPIVMDFHTDDDGVGARIGGLLLHPRSLLVLSDAAYTDIYHAISPRQIDTLDHTILNIPASHHGAELQRTTRTSLTIRSCHTVANPLGRRKI